MPTTKSALHGRFSIVQFPVIWCSCENSTFREFQENPFWESRLHRDPFEDCPPAVRPVMDRNEKKKVSAKYISSRWVPNLVPQTLSIAYTNRLATYVKHIVPEMISLRRWIAFFHIRGALPKAVNSWVVKQTKCSSEGGVKHLVFGRIEMYCVGMLMSFVMAHAQFPPNSIRIFSCCIYSLML